MDQQALNELRRTAFLLLMKKKDKIMQTQIITKMERHRKQIPKSPSSFHPLS